MRKSILNKKQLYLSFSLTLMVVNLALKTALRMPTSQQRLRDAIETQVKHFTYIC